MYSELASKNSHRFLEQLVWHNDCVLTVYPVDFCVLLDFFVAHSQNFSANTVIETVGFSQGLCAGYV